MYNAFVDINYNKSHITQNCVKSKSLFCQPQSDHIISCSRKAQLYTPNVNMMFLDTKDNIRQEINCNYRTSLKQKLPCYNYLWPTIINSISPAKSQCCIEQYPESMSVKSIKNVHNYNNCNYNNCNCINNANNVNNANSANNVYQKLYHTNVTINGGGKNDLESTEIDIFAIRIKNSIHLFELIDDGKYDEFIDFIENTNTEHIDLNIKNRHNNYIIQLAIVQNNIKILKKILDHNIRLDILDENGHSILYYPVKFNYVDIIKILIEYDKRNLGISIINIHDKMGNTALHYCILFNNVTIFNLLLNANGDINATNNELYNSLHMAVYKKNKQFVDLIITKTKNINHKTKSGETALHISVNLQLFEIVKILLENKADPNIREYENRFTPIFYSVGLNNYEITKLLIKYGSDLLLQDYSGNTIFHYTITDNHDAIIDLLFKNIKISIMDMKMYDEIDEIDEKINIINAHKNQVNLTNIEGNTFTHLLLYNFKNEYVQYIKIIMPYVNVNIQNNQGDTILHLLIDRRMWKNFINILSKKKMNIFIKNSDGICPYDHIFDEDRDVFIKMVANSYFNELRKKKDWGKKWQNECSQIKKNNEIFNECELLIREDILKNKLSYPVKKKHIEIKLDPQNHVEFVTFTGIRLDTFMGLIYLIDKYKSTITIYSKNRLRDKLSNEELNNYYKSLGLSMSNLDLIYNNEISWIFQKIFFPNNFDNDFIDIIKKKKYKIFIMPIGIELSNGSHSNYLIYYIDTFIMERFEPHGSDYPYGFNYNPELLDDHLHKKFYNLIKQAYSNDPGFKYFKPSEYLPKIGFQQHDIFESKKYLSDPGGFCALWCIWYVDFRLKYINIETKKIINKLIKYIYNHNRKFREIIRNYSVVITNFRDNFLKKYNKTINDIINYDVTWLQHLEIYDDIIKYVSSRE